MSGTLAFGTRAVASLGLRLLSLDRPGLGRSSPHASKTLDSWAVDVAELIGSARLTRPLAVGFSQGAPFALALARRELVAGVAIVSGQDELYHPSVRGLLPPEIEMMVTQAQADPDELQRTFSGMATADGMWNLITSMSGPRDRELYTSSGFAELFLRALQEGFQQGPEGYARDLANALGRWPFELQQIRFPSTSGTGGRIRAPSIHPTPGHRSRRGFLPLGEHSTRRRAARYSGPGPARSSPT